MTNNIPKISLEDSLYVLQLARETALAQNRQAQAKRMSPVVEEIRGLVTNPPQNTSAAPAAGAMAQSDFQALLNLQQNRLETQPATASTSTNSVMERNRMIHAMAQANMSEVDIARQFSMSREEVQLVLNIQQKNR